MGVLDGVRHVRCKNNGVCDVGGTSDVRGIARRPDKQLVEVLDGVRHVRRKNNGVCDVGVR